MSGTHLCNPVSIRFTQKDGTILAIDLEKPTASLAIPNVEVAEDLKVELLGSKKNEMTSKG